MGDINVPNNNTQADDNALLTYQQKLHVARYKATCLLSRKTVKKQKKVMEWTVVKDYAPDLTPEVHESRDEHKSKIGLNNLHELLNKYGYEHSDESYSLSNTSSNREDTTPKSLRNSTIFAELYLKLSYRDWELKVMKMNQLIREDNKQSNKEIKDFEPWDFIIGHALMIGASCYCQLESVLFDDSKENEDKWDKIMQKENFSRHMKLYQFKEFRHYLPRIWEKPATKDQHPWRAFEGAVKEFNDIRDEEVIDSWVKVLDVSMIAWRPRTQKNGGLPNISYII